jgi:hypothetical protein
MNLKQLERLIESLEEFKSFQQALKEERNAREARQMLAVEATRPEPRVVYLPPRRPIDDLPLDRRRVSQGRPVAPRAVPARPIARARRRRSRVPSSPE